MNNIQVGFIPSDKINLIWEQVSPLLQTVIDRPQYGYDIDYIKELLNTGKSWLVCAFEENIIIACFVCKQIDYPHRKVLYVSMGAGEPAIKWKMPVVDFMKQGARNIGASHIEWHGRKGLEKLFADVAQFQHVAMIIPIGEENG